MVHPDEEQIKEFLFLHQPNLLRCPHPQAAAVGI